jgi:probable F420-dependent oxidoreductase
MRFDFHYQHSIEELREVPEEFARLEKAGYGGIWVREADRNSFLPLAVGAIHTHEIEIGNGVAVAFARSPMIAAQLGHDLQIASRGRYVLGLGSQMRHNIVHRFSMPFDPPGSRMRDYVCAVKAVWRCWNDGEPLDYHGQFYTLDSMEAYYTPTSSPWGPPAVFMGAAGEKMIRVAGEVAEGIFLHSLLTPAYLSEVLKPSWTAGLEHRAAPLQRPFETSAPVLTVTGRDDAEMAIAAQSVRARIAHLGAKQAYRRVFDHHGWGHIHEEWARMVERGETTSMGDLVDDEMLRAFAVVAEPEHVAAAIVDRYDGLSDRASVMTPYATTHDLWDSISIGIRAHGDSVPRRQ